MNGSFGAYQVPMYLSDLALFTFSLSKDKMLFCEKDSDFMKAFPFIFGSVAGMSLPLTCLYLHPILSVISRAFLLHAPSQ